MTQIADEIRALIADLYDDPEDYLRRPHLWFGGRSPNELMTTEGRTDRVLRLLGQIEHGVYP
jgi:uncharacterized protein (DUF2384 family)